MVVAFGGVTDVCAFEEATQGAGAAGRLIPTPLAVAASCGFAWGAPDQSRGSIDAPVIAQGLAYEGICMVP